MKQKIVLLIDNKNQLYAFKKQEVILKKRYNPLPFKLTNLEVKLAEKYNLFGSV